MALVRVQLKRTKGWRMPPNTVKVDRTTKFGNPHDWREWRDGAPDVFWCATERDQWCREQATEAFAADLRDGTIMLPVHELQGLNLACWCNGPRFSCHADVLLEVANGPAHSSKEPASVCEHREQAAPATDEPNTSNPLTRGEG